MAASITICRTGASTVNAGLTRYSSIAGHLTLGTTEALTHIPVYNAGSFSWIGVYCSAFSLTGGTPTATFYLGKNTTPGSASAGSTTALSVSITTTGLFESATSVSFSSGNACYYQCTTGGTGGSITLRTASIQFDPNDATQCVTYLASRGVASTTVDNATFYCPPSGYLDAWDTSETEREIPIRFQVTWDRMYAYISANTRAVLGNTFFRTRFNGTNGNHFLTFAGGETGYKFHNLTDNKLTDTFSNFSMETTDNLGIADGGTISVALIGCSLISQTREFVMISSQASGGVSLTNSTLHYLAVGGRVFSETTEDRAEAQPHFKMYCRALECYIGANTLATAANRSTLTLRDGGVSSLLAAATGSDANVITSSGSQKILIDSGVDTISLEFDTTDSSVGAASMWWTSMVGGQTKSSILQRRSTQRSLVTR